jgi:hypothetical protein
MRIRVDLDPIGTVVPDPLRQNEPHLKIILEMFEMLVFSLGGQEASLGF